MTPRSNVECPGIDGASPLGMLASLGLFRLAALADSDVQLSWRRAGTWIPAYSTTLADLDAMAAHLAAWLGCLARTGQTDSTEPRRRVAALQAEFKRVHRTLKDAEGLARREASARHLARIERDEFVMEAGRDIRMSLQDLENRLRGAQEELSEALGAGIAHLGAIIGVPATLFRSHALRATEAWIAEAAAHETQPRTAPAGLLAELLAALGSDGVTQDGRVVPTPYSFGNGASNQNLLKDFRACAARCAVEDVERSLRGDPSACAVHGDVTSLNWDPADERSYALRWRNPADTASKAPVDLALNALAYVGLSTLPVMPAGAALAAVGWSTAGPGWTWPIWTCSLSLPAVRSLLASRELQAEVPDRRRLSAQGVGDVRRCRRLTINKRYFFAPSVSV